MPATKLTQKQAAAVVARYIGGFQNGDAYRESGSLHLMPSAIVNDKFAEGFEFGNGRGLVKVWQFTFKRQGVMGPGRRRSTPPPARC